MSPGVDQAVIRLGMPGVVRGVVVDTAFFKGNYPPFCWVEGARVDGYPSGDEITEWFPLVERSPLQGTPEALLRRRRRSAASRTSG